MEVVHSPKVNHNVYVLGAGFSFDGGVPLVENFLERMADAQLWLTRHEEPEADSVSKVFRFKLNAAAAAYRAKLNIENIEELFSLAAVSEDRIDTSDVTSAIAATIAFARGTAPESTCLVTEKKVLEESGSWSREEKRIPTYHLYAGLLSGRMCEDQHARNTVITFNYDTLLEDALIAIGGSIDYGFDLNSVQYHPSTDGRFNHSPDAVPIYKLHGSVNWSAGSREDDPITVYGSYSDLRSAKKNVLLLPPTWRKTFGGQLTSILSKAVEALTSATRIIILGFSMPSTDNHFKYLIAAGLQKNISLRKILFVNPGLADESEAENLRGNLFTILRQDLEERRILEFVSSPTSTFLLSRKNSDRINRSFYADCLEIAFEGTHRIDRFAQGLGTLALN